MSAVTVKDRVTGMVRDVLGPPMKAGGFQRTGRVFWRDQNDVCQVVYVEMSRWGTRDDSSFHVKLGVFWHAVEKLIDNTSYGKMPPPEFRCTFRIDLGQCISMPPKPSWQVVPSSDYEAIGREVIADLQKHGLPWLNYRSDLRHALELMDRPGAHEKGKHFVHELLNVRARVVFLKMLERHDEALAQLRQIAKNGYPEDAIALAGRLEFDPASVSDGSRSAAT